jgi:hypothetical protein
MQGAFTMSRSRPVLRLLLAAGLCGAACRAAAQAQARVTFPGSVKEVPSAVTGAKRAAAISRTVLRTEERSAVMSFEVALRMRSFDELQARVAGGEQITPSEMAAKYYPMAADHDRLVKWLKAQGLEVTRTDGNRLAVFARGSVDAVSAAFQVTFARVTAADGGEFTSAVTEPSLPADIAAGQCSESTGFSPTSAGDRSQSRGRPQPRATITVGGYYAGADSRRLQCERADADWGRGRRSPSMSWRYPSNPSDLTSFWSQPRP